MVVSPRGHNGSDAGVRDAVLAQYLVTKVNWKGSYKRILSVTPSSVLTYNPENYQCTSQWDLSEIEDVEAANERDQFLIRLEKARFRLAKVRFQCAARAHFISLITKLRRHFAIQPVQFTSVGVGAQWKKYRCIEFFGDGSSQSYFLEIGVSALSLLNDEGQKMDALPLIYLKKAASSYSHPDGIVLGTPYQERLFLCSQRNECLGDIYVAAAKLGVDLRLAESPLDVQLLRLRNSQMLDHPAIACFEVLKSGEDGNVFVEVQLVLQSEALVEVHPQMRAVVTRKYSTLLNVIRAEWDPETVGLEFAEGESLVVKLEARDQLITLLLLACRENECEHVMLTATEIKTNRMYYPHVNENASESAASLMESFFLRRVLQTSQAMTEQLIPAHGTLPGALLRKQSAPENGWLQRRTRLRKRSEPVVHGARDSFETGESMNDYVSPNIAMEELNANIPLNETSLFCHKAVLNDAIELLADHLASLVSTLRRFVNAANAEIVTTLQALVRLCYSSNASLSDRMILRVFDAVLELLVQQDFLTCYWCLQLLQCFFDASRVELTDDQRAKVLAHVSTQRELLSAIIDLLPSSSPASSRSSGFWLLGSDGVMAHMSRHSSMDSTLQSKEARLEKDMNIVFYEALATAHQIIVYLHEKDDVSQMGEAQQVLRESNHKSTSAPPRRKTMPAAYTTAIADASSEIFAKQKRFLAEKLLEKHQFLMDSVVDTRLVRACHTSAVLMRFLTLELERHRTPPLGTTFPGAKQSCAISRPGDGSSRKAVINQSSSTESGGSRGGDAQRHERRTVRRGATIANVQGVRNPHDTENGPDFPNFGLEDVQARKLTQLDVFLASYSVKIRAQNDRSHLFKGERAIQIPLTGFSQSSDGIPVSGKTQSAACMNLKHQELLEGEANSDADDEEDAKEVNKFSLSFRNASENAPRSSDVLSDEQGRDRAPSDLFRSSTFYAEQEKRERGGSRQHERRRSATGRRARRSQSSPAIRADTHDCDACICCNDICGNIMCFFCSEKKYQLKATFPDSSPSSRGGPPSQSAPSSYDNSHDNYLPTERKYSSCEVKRCQSLRSCWVVVDGDVYNITDLLSVHPGGLQVLLQAAQRGEDCRAILDEHPPSARRILSKYRLGEYYECEKRTLFP